jgi:hypothetical protein
MISLLPLGAAVASGLPTLCPGAGSGNPWPVGGALLGAVGVFLADQGTAEE